eukprot:CAMPEP_0182442718 /NCGR_PEP_ID=MMETSP1172-20130603/1622_1 /TAXON_ID=708627 /ORGANISM="Timspurckia oligopyrenoides, Strain CCMP3278" /LENGTH=652 /DNA_ID=CAMNT_0024637735 /DNA_START=241 /DNA_END=2196 /DNA_ORIENTATION=+
MEPNPNHNVNENAPNRSTTVHEDEIYYKRAEELFSKMEVARHEMIQLESEIDGLLDEVIDNDVLDRTPSALGNNSRFNRHQQTVNAQESQGISFFEGAIRSTGVQLRGHTKRFDTVDHDNAMDTEDDGAVMHSGTIFKDAYLKLSGRHQKQEESDTNSDTQPQKKNVPKWVRRHGSRKDEKLHSCGYWTLFSWFVLMFILSIIFIIFTTIDFVDQLNNPIAQYDFEVQQQLYLPTIIVCPIDRMTPYFSNHTLLFNTRKLLELYQFRSVNGDVCTRLDVSQQSESCAETIRGLFIAGDDYTSEDCARELSVMDPLKWMNVSFLSETPCKYCFIVNENQDQFVTDSYISQTNTIQMQSAQEYYQCIYDPGGLLPSLLGTGDEMFSINGLIKSGFRSELKSAGILEYSEDELSATMNADFSSEQACNVLFFSGFFVPVSDGVDVKYQWSSVESKWIEIGNGPYFRVRSDISVMSSGSFEVYLEPPERVVQEERNSLKFRQVSTIDHKVEEQMEVSKGEQSVNRQLRKEIIEDFIGEVSKRTFLSMETKQKHVEIDKTSGNVRKMMNETLHGVDRHAISPRTRPIRAPLVLVGGYDLVFLSFVQQTIEGVVTYTWGSSSSFIFTPLNSPHTGNLEYGFTSLLTESFYRRTVVDYW